MSTIRCAYTEWLLLGLTFFCASAFAQWQEGSTVGVPSDNAKRPIGLFVRYDGQSTIPNMQIPPDAWITVDLANGQQWCVNGDCVTFQPNLPADTKAIFLSGLLVITYPFPTNNGACNLWANFRAPGSRLPLDSYQVQTIEANGGGGQRSNAAVWVPVKDRKFEFYWHFTTGAMVCPSLINLSLQAYVR